MSPKKKAVKKTAVKKAVPKKTVPKAVKAHVIKKSSPAKKPSVKASHPPITRFAAIDFETADYGRDSACALAVILAENGKIIRKEHFLIKPPRKDFVFTYIHGITWGDVAKKPVFGDIWRDVTKLIEDVDFIAAHNASFDRSVLHACCETACANPPYAPFVCTMKLARMAWDIRPTKLPDVCGRFKIPLDHHDALSDATACARIVLEAMGQGLDPRMVIEKKKAG